MTYPKRYVLDLMDAELADHFDVDVDEDLNDPYFAPRGYFVQRALNERGEAAIRAAVERGTVIVWEEGMPYPA